MNKLWPHLARDKRLDFRAKKSNKQSHKYPRIGAKRAECTKEGWMGAIFDFLGTEELI